MLQYSVGADDGERERERERDFKSHSKRPNPPPPPPPLLPLSPHTPTNVGLPGLAVDGGLPAGVRGVGTIPPVPVAGRVVAGLVAVAVRDPTGGTAVRTVRHWPREVHLQHRGLILIQGGQGVNIGQLSQGINTG